MTDLKNHPGMWIDDREFNQDLVRALFKRVEEEENRADYEYEVADAARHNHSVLLDKYAAEVEKRMALEKRVEELEGREKEEKLGKCDRCGREQIAVEFLPDPYVDEIHPDRNNPPSWWCDDCYREACDEI